MKMETTEIKLFSFSELPENEQQNQIDKRREWDVEDVCWYDDILENNCNRLEDKGIICKSADFSFDVYRNTISVSPVSINERRFVNSHPQLLKMFPTLQMRINDKLIDIGFNKGHAYVDIVEKEEDEMETIDILGKALEPAEIYDLERDIEKEAQAILEEELEMVLKDIKEEYDYLTSDEHIKERLIDDEVKFTLHNGKYIEW